MSGEMDLATVSVILNTAFDLAHHAEDDFKSTFPALKSADEVTSLILDALPRYAPAPAAEFITEWMFGTPYGVFNFSRDLFKLGKHPAAHVKTYDPSTDRSSMSFSRRSTKTRYSF